MPLIEVSMAKTSVEKKRELIEKLSADAIAITGIPANEFTVFINEYETDNIGRSGRTLTDIRAGKV